MSASIYLRRRRWRVAESVGELAVQQRFLTDDEMKNAKAVVGWQFWVAPVMSVAASLGVGIGALGGNPVIMIAFLVVGSLAAVQCLFWVHNYKKVTHDIERRVVEVIEGAPEQVWMSRAGFCYLGIAGRTIRVSNDVYGELRESNMVRVAFLPTARVAVEVKAVRGISFSPSLN